MPARKRMTRIAVMKCSRCGQSSLVVQDLGIPWTGRQGKVKTLAGQCSCEALVAEYEWEVPRSELKAAIGGNTFTHW